MSIRRSVRRSVRQSVRRSVPWSVRPSVRPLLFLKVKSMHTRRILCRVSSLVIFDTRLIYAPRSQILKISTDMPVGQTYRQTHPLIGSNIHLEPIEFFSQEIQMFPSFLQFQANDHHRRVARDRMLDG